MYKIIIILIMVPLLFSCSVPKNMRTDSIPTVKDFNLVKYLGTWYEIARMPHKFEEDLANVTASYKMDDDGDIIVVNRGYDTTSNEWSQAEGKAYIPDTRNPSELKVSFFLWFYSPYRIIKLDKDYRWAVVTSSSKKYLWILARKPDMKDELYSELIEFLKENKFMVEKLKRISHKKRD